MVSPSARSPPRRQNKLPAEVEMLDRQIGFVMEELRTLQELPSVSECCKEVHEFVGSNPDPLIPAVNKKKHKSCSVWKWLRRANVCFNPSLFCCSCFCSLQLETLDCRCHRRSSPNDCCCNCGNISFCSLKCLRPSLSCPQCSCGCVWSCCPNCTEVRLCPKCSKSCCKNICLC